MNIIVQGPKIRTKIKPTAAADTKDKVVHKSLQHTVRSFSKEMASVSVDKGPFSVQKSLLSIFENVSKPKVVQFPAVKGSLTAAKMVSPVIPVAKQLNTPLISGFGYFSHEGILETYNDDRVIICSHLDAKLPEGVALPEILDTVDSSLDHVLRAIQYSLFAIFDGHGGAKASEYCHTHFASQFLKFLLQSLKAQILFFLKEKNTACELDQIQNTVKAFCKSFDTQLVNYLAGPSVDEKSGVAAIVIFTLMGKLYLFHIGNCKAFRVKSVSDPKIEYLTRDHTPALTQEADRVKKLGGYITRSSFSTEHFPNPRRPGVKMIFPTQRGPLRVYPGNLPISRTLGDFHVKRGYPNLLSNEPEVIELDEKFNYIVLGSNGLFETIKEDSIFATLVQSILEQHNFGNDRAACEGVCAALSQKVLELQPRNNFSGILLCSSSFRVPYQRVESEVAAPNNPKLSLIRKQVLFESFRHPQT